MPFRAENTGEAISLMSSEDLYLVRKIEKVLGKPIERFRSPDFEYGKFVEKIHNVGIHSKPKERERKRTNAKTTREDGSRTYGRSGSTYGERKRTNAKTTREAPHNHFSSSKRRGKKLLKRGKK